jgi:hypothetical protein
MFVLTHILLLMSKLLKKQDVLRIQNTITCHNANPIIKNKLRLKHTHKPSKSHVTFHNVLKMAIYKKKTIESMEMVTEI